MTAIAVLGTLRLVNSWASRSSAQALSIGSLLIACHGASWTNRKGNSPSFQSWRQFLMSVGKRVRYS
jgi:hypothetical protein